MEIETNTITKKTHTLIKTTQTKIMAQAQPERKIEEHQELAFSVGNKDLKNSRKLLSINSTSSCSDSFKFNAQAPEFVPRSLSSSNQNSQTTQLPISGYYYPCFHYLGATAGSDWFFVGEHGPHNSFASAAASASTATYLINSNPNPSLPNNTSNKTTLLTDDLRQKILKQVEYQFSDMSLLANESMSKHISKDHEGYVPISVIASTKKMKSLVNNNHLIAQALQFSSKLVPSEDGKKVKRKYPFTEKDREELQSRTVVVENLPEDHSHQNLEKIFSVVGSVRTIRICHPQESNSSRTKSDFFMCNKLHALVEFESSETAEKAVEKLNDERNWRKGLRVRVLLRCSPKSVLKSRKSDFDGLLDDEELTFPESNEDPSLITNAESVTETNNVCKAEENSGSSKKTWAKGRGKGRGRGQRGMVGPSPPQLEASLKNTSKGPRMPDGTRGFTLGRGMRLTTLPTSMLASMDF